MSHTYPLIKGVVDSFLAGEGYMGKSESRLYGIGCSLDVAGSRFAVVLIMIAYITTLKVDVAVRKYIWLYIAAFLYITVVGNMMARTTTMGVGLALLYWLGKSGVFNLRINSEYKYIWNRLGLLLLVAIPFMVYLYDTNPVFKEDIRFAFEGFFSLAEKGEWDVGSNDSLANMYVFSNFTFK